VKNIEITKTQPAKNEYEYFDIKYGSAVEELGEGMMTIFKEMVAMHEDLKKAHQD